MKKYARKLWHLLGLVTPLVYGFGWITRETALFWLILAFMMIIVGEAVRFAHLDARRGYNHVFSILMRDIEKTAINASVHFVIGNFLAVLLFPREVACLAIAFLAIGDTTAGIVGSAWGRIKIYAGKTLEGSAAFTLICFLIAVWFVPWPAALAGALLAATTELFVSGVYDNLTIPVAAGIGMSGTMVLLGLI
ncbi:MAG: hypothetical protein GY771_06835 [bacterium]|nr:hypothetical protein [bacterium]